MIIDPWGTVVAQCSEGEGFAIACIDHKKLKEVREGMAVWDNRRNDLYGLAAKDDFYSSSSDFDFGNIDVPNNHIVFESKLSVVLVNKKPVLPGHLLVIPRRKAKRMPDLTAAEIADLFMTVQNAQKITEKHFNCQSSTISIQDGVDAGQTVQHLHVHVLPRKPGDFKRNDDIYDALEKHDKDPNGWREAKEMADEAALMRKTFNDIFGKQN